MTKAHWAYGGLLIAVLPTIALAQAQPGAAPASHTADPENTIGEIVVTAQKRSEKLQDVPISVTTQSAAQLQAAGVTTTSDLTKVVPGLVFAQNEAFSQPAIRGVTSSSTSAGAESPVAIYLDGIYQPSQNGVLFDLPDVDRIEVLKGPQGTLFGRNATGGAIQIFTRDPTFHPSGKFTVSEGYYTGTGGARPANEVNVNGFVSGPLISDVLAGSISGFYRKNQGYMTNDVDNGRSGQQETAGFRGKLLWQPTDGVRIVATGYYSRLKDYASYNRSVFEGLTVAASFPDVVLPAQPWHVSSAPGLPNSLRTETWGGSVRATFDLPAGTVTSLTGFSDSRNTDYVAAAGAYSPSCTATFACANYGLTVNSKAVSEEIDFVSRKVSIFSITSGLFLYHNYGQTQGVQVFGGPGASILAFTEDDSVKTDAYALFTEVNADITDHIHVIAGGRYSVERKYGFAAVNANPVGIPGRTDNAFTPRVSVRYAFDPRTNVYFTFSKGFKSGILPPPTQVPLVATRPEKLTSYEVGFKTAQPTYNFNLAYFHYDYTDMQETIFVGALAFPQNAAGSKMDGVDMDGALKLGHNIQLNAGFNYTPHAEFTAYPGAAFFLPPPTGIGAPVTVIGDAAGVRLQRIPRFSGSLGVSWSQDLANGQVGATANVYHSSSYNWDLAGTQKTKPYDDVSAQVYYQTANHVRFTLFGKNLLNKHYIVGSQPSANTIPVLYAPPQQVGASASYEF